MTDPQPSAPTSPPIPLMPCVEANDAPTPGVLGAESFAYVGQGLSCSVKRSRIVKDTIRLWKDTTRDMVMAICCGLHNFRLRLCPWPSLYKNRDTAYYLSAVRHNYTHRKEVNERQFLCDGIVVICQKQRQWRL